MALAVLTVTNSIAALSVSGVRICDVDEIPTTADLDRGPTLYPEPVGFVQSLIVERDSTCVASLAKKHATYVLRYTFAYHRDGMTRDLPTLYAGAVDKAADVLDALIANDTITGAINITPSISGGFGPVASPDGNLFIGCIINIEVLEFIN